MSLLDKINQDVHPRHKKDFLKSKGMKKGLTAALIALGIFHIGVLYNVVTSEDTTEKFYHDNSQGIVYYDQDGDGEVSANDYLYFSRGELDTPTYTGVTEAFQKKDAAIFHDGLVFGVKSPYVFNRELYVVPESMDGSDNDMSLTVTQAQDILYSLQNK